MSLVKVSALSALPPGTVAEIENRGATYAVGNADGQLFCFDGTCPHAGGPLGEGTLNGNLLTCPWHGWEFDCRTGVNDFDEDVKLQSYPILIQGQDVLADLP
jgi:nitrite reductase/ring-hydroxylating ferredoxin subunit